ncbi:MAG TPA: hypothetical protein PLA77_03255, partial [Bacteroidales bacterium]|nr:hypothetical protein [Bacteroidales bacterium]
ICFAMIFRKKFITLSDYQFITLSNYHFITPSFLELYFQGFGIGRASWLRHPPYIAGVFAGLFFIYGEFYSHVVPQCLEFGRRTR